MPDDEKIKKVLEKAKGKKAKAKPVKEEVAGTKSQGLPKDLKAAMEEHFGANLSKVRLHTGGNAKDVAKSIGAKAFTFGNDVYLSDAKYANDKEFLAHELAHVIQAGGGKKPPPEKAGKALVSK
ncbi:MAG: DUF4157 domain-containing protein [Pseudomonadota bacterium]